MMKRTVNLPNVCICNCYNLITRSGTSYSMVLRTDWYTDFDQSSAIYWYQCGDLGCDDEYIGKTSRTFGERYKEHLMPPSAIHQHSSQTGHPTNHNNFQIRGREGHNLARNIKESILLGLIILL